MSTSTSVTSSYGRIGGIQDGLNLPALRLGLLGTTPVYHTVGAIAQGTGAVTLTPEQTLCGLLFDDPEGAQTLTLPTAALMVAAFGDDARVGLTWELKIANDATNASGEAITIAAGTGCTLSKPTGVTATITEGTSHYGILVFRLSNITSGSEAYTCHLLTEG